MADVVAVDQFLDGWYPGYTPENLDNPWLRMKSKPFSKEDESSFWFVDFHWPRGFSPLGMMLVCDANWGTQLAAHQLPLPPAGGLVQRMGGPFLYEGEVPITSPWEIGLPGGPDREEHAARSSRTSTPSGKSASGSSTSGSATSRATTSTASRWPTSACTCATPGRSSAGRGRSTSRSCIRCWRSTSSCTACAPPTASTPPTSPRCCRAASTRSPRPTAPCGTSPMRPSGSASPTSSPPTRPPTSVARCRVRAATPRCG